MTGRQIDFVSQFQITRRIYERDDGVRKKSLALEIHSSSKRMDMELKELSNCEVHVHTRIRKIKTT